MSIALPGHIQRRKLDDHPRLARAEISREHIDSTFLRWIESKHRKKYFLYLHYMPSVLQLHLEEEEEEEEEEDLFVFNDTIEAHAASSSSIFMPAPTNSTSTPAARTSSLSLSLYIYIDICIVYDVK